MSIKTKLQQLEQAATLPENGEHQHVVYEDGGTFCRSEARGRRCTGAPALVVRVVYEDGGLQDRQWIEP